MSGTAEKILEYLLETYICVNCEEGDTNLDDFFNTFVVFMPTNQICATLLAIYKAKPQQRNGENIDLALREKVKVIRFILEWHDVSKESFFEDPKIMAFLTVNIPLNLSSRKRTDYNQNFIIGITEFNSARYQDISSVERRNQIN